MPKFRGLIELKKWCFVLLCLLVCLFVCVFVFCKRSNKELNETFKDFDGFAIKLDATPLSSYRQNLKLIFNTHIFWFQNFQGNYSLSLAGGSWVLTDVWFCTSGRWWCQTSVHSASTVHPMMMENGFFENFWTKKCECWRSVLNFVYMSSTNTYKSIHRTIFL